MRSYRCCKRDPRDRKIAGVLLLNVSGPTKEFPQGVSAAGGCRKHLSRKLAHPRVRPEPSEQARNKYTRTEQTPEQTK